LSSATPGSEFKDVSRRFLSDAQLQVKGHVGAHWHNFGAPYLVDWDGDGWMDIFATNHVKYESCETHWCAAPLPSTIRTQLLYYLKACPACQNLGISRAITANGLMLSLAPSSTWRVGLSSPTTIWSKGSTPTEVQLLTLTAMGCWTSM